MNESTVVFDIETVRGVLAPDESPWPGIEYAKSWEDYRGMGIACICAFDYEERRFRVFDNESLVEFRRLLRSRSRFVSWNGHKFDNRLLDAHGIHVDEAGSLDLMELFSRRIKLEKAAMANGIDAKKSMPGREAPIRWQQGQYARVIDYCIGDVHITCMLYAKLVKQGYLYDPVSKKHVGTGTQLPTAPISKAA